MSSFRQSAKHAFIDYTTPRGTAQDQRVRAFSFIFLSLLNIFYVLLS